MPSIASRTISRSSGFTSTVTRSRSTIPRSAPWTDSTTRSGSTAITPATIFFGQREPELDGAALQRSAAAA